MTSPAGPGPNESSKGAARRIGRLTLKELRETLRDRRTIVTLVLMPVLVYPLLSLVFQKFLVTSLQPTHQTIYQIAVPSRDEAFALNRALSEGDRMLREAGNTATGEDYEPVLLENVEEAVAGSDADIGVRRRIRTIRRAAPTDRSEMHETSTEFELFLLRSSRLGRDAAAFIERRLNALVRTELAQRVRQRGGDGTPPLTVTTRLLEPKHGSTAFSLSALVPLILILMTITGAVYPAIDLTAGERERGTLEALIAAPVPRLGLLIAKYIAVLTVALLTATVNLVSMTVTIWAVGLSPLLFGEAGVTWQLIAKVFGLLMLFAAFFSALLLAVTSFARSFKEAQAYLIPLMLISMTPGVVSLLPGVELDAALAVTPLLNIVLLARDLFEQHQADPVLTLVVILSTALFAAASLGIAARIFGADAILYGGHGTWSDLFRRPEEPSPAPTAASAMFCLAMLFPAHFLFSHLVARMGGASTEMRLLTSAGLTVLLFAGLPIVAAAARRVKLPQGLGLRGFRWPALFGAALLGLSLWTLATEMVALLRDIGLVPLDDALREKAQELAASWRRVSPWLLVLTLGVAPAVCEELFFRGFLLGALRTRLVPWQAIVASAMLFGAFHVVMAGGLATIRFVPSTFLGLVLGWVCVRTGSVLPGMLLHAVHNGLLVTISRYQTELMRRGWDAENATHLPATWLAAGCVAALVGAGLVWISGRRSEPGALDYSA